LSQTKDYKIAICYSAKQQH